MYVYIEQGYDTSDFGKILHMEFFDERPTFAIHKPCATLWEGDVNGGDSVRVDPKEQKVWHYGHDAAKAAASWIVDGNTSQNHIHRMIKWMDDGDDVWRDYAPTMPNLSGEHADDPTPQVLASWVIGNHWEEWMEEDDGVGLSELTDLYEEAVSYWFPIYCERELRNALAAAAIPRGAPGCTCGTPPFAPPEPSDDCPFHSDETTSGVGWPE